MFRKKKYFRCNNPEQRFSGFIYLLKRKRECRKGEEGEMGGRGWRGEGD